MRCVAALEEGLRWLPDSRPFLPSRPQVKELLNQVLIADPAARINLATVKQNGWFLVNYVEPAPVEGQLDGAADAEAAAEPGDLESAVQETTVAEDAPGAEAKAAEAKAAATAAELPRRLNAFDLINQCGGIALNRMLLTPAERQVRPRPCLLSDGWVPTPHRAFVNRL